MPSELRKAMILAAGFGTRLKPLTLEMPKALVKYKGIPLIEHVIKKLIFSGIEEIVINTHYFSGQVENYFKEHDFGITIKLSHEEEILGTGGGIKNARRYLDDAGSFIVYNTDVISNIDIGDMFLNHNREDAFITLAVNERDTSRPLLFGENKNLSGYVSGIKTFSNSETTGIKKGFCGIHILSSDIFNLFPPENKFDIIPFYCRLACQKYITFYDIADTYWKDLGKFEDFG